MNNIFKWLMIHNIAVVIGFIILAIIFKHWWIVLFSLLFTRSFKFGGDNKESDK